MHDQCVGCEYKRLLNSAMSITEYCCHYLLDTGHGRAIAEDGRCLSKKNAAADCGAKILETFDEVE